VLLIIGCVIFFSLCRFIASFWVGVVLFPRADGWNLGRVGGCVRGVGGEWLVFFGDVVCGVC
jgi:hypothetical protein